MLTSLGMIFICGLLLGSLFKKMSMPSLIGMLATGIILGPYVLNLLDESILLIGLDLRELALIIILTRAGLSLDLDDLKAIGRPAVLMSFLPACFEMAGTIIFAPLLLNVTYLEAALLGAVIASASPAVIIPRMLKLMDEGYGTDKKIPQMILAGDSIDDIFNIVVFSALLTLHSAGSVHVMSLLVIPTSIVFGIILGLIGGYLITHMFKRRHIRDSVKIIILLGISFMMIALEAYLEDMISISGLLSIMVMGVVILKKRPLVAKRLSIKFSKLWIAAEIVLFVMVGAAVNINVISGYLWQSILLLVIILTIRGIGIWICLIKTPLNVKEKVFTVLTGIPKATVQAAIGSIPLALGIPSGEIILAVSVISILFTAPIGALMIDHTYKKMLSKQA